MLSENIKVSEVSDILRKQLEGIDTRVQLDEIGPQGPADLDRHHDGCVAVASDVMPERAHQRRVDRLRHDRHQEQL